MSGSGNGARAAILGLGVVVIGVVGFLVWFAVSGATSLTNQASDLTTSAPAAANTAALMQEVGGLQVVVTTLLIEDPQVIPSVALAGGTYVVTGGGSAQEVPASAAAVAAGLDIRSHDEPCVWVRAADGTIVHSMASTGPSNGGC